MAVSETLNTGANAERMRLQKEQEAAEKVAAEQVTESAPHYMEALAKINNQGQA